MRRLPWAIAGFAALTLTCSRAHGQERSNLELLNNTTKHDGQNLICRGEVIGDIMRRGDHAWIHLNDGTATIGIWAAADDVRSIATTGSYGRRGDTVEINGTLHRSCPEHAGDLDIHAQSLIVLSPGSTLATSVSVKKRFAGTVSFFLVLVSYALKRMLRRTGSGHTPSANRQPR